MALKIFHAYHHYATTDVNTIRREGVAAISWRIAASNSGGNWIDGGSCMSDYPRKFRDNDRDLPFLKDIIDVAWLKTSEPSDLIFLSNTDSVIPPDFYAQVSKLIAGGANGFFGARRDFTRIEKPLTSSEIAGGKDYSGKDLFGFTAGWWKENRKEFPDMCFGVEAWDGVLFMTLEKAGAVEAKLCCAHEIHSARWIQPHNRTTLPSQRHNHILASKAFRDLGIPWKERTYGAVPKWTADPTKLPVISSFAAWHLGDNLIHLNWLRKVALKNPERRFEHYALPEHLEQMAEFVADTKNITLGPLEKKPANSVDSWKNADGFFDRHPLKLQWVKFHLDWFRHLAQRLGVENPITRPDDLLMDSPAIQKDCGVNGDYDCLVFNSRPGSAQFRLWTPDYMDPIILALQAAGHRPITTAANGVGAPTTLDLKLTAAGIGNLSLRTPVVVGIPVGLIFPIFNIWNREIVKTRIVMIDNGETLLGMPNAYSEVKTREQALDILKRQKVI